MKQLFQLADQGYLAPIDAAFGDFLARRAAPLSDACDVDVVATAGALVSAERARGHSCLDLSTLPGITRWPESVGIAMPEPDICRSILTRSGLCTDGSELSPLVLDGDRLYLHRFHTAERRLAASIRARIHSPASDPSTLTPDTISLFHRLFEGNRAASLDWQAVAAAAALRGRLTVITGGPGTGKTTTIARCLALLLHREPDLQIAIAAPTGKAAARLAEAIHASAANLPIDGAIRAALPQDGTTLHRLLGYQPWRDRFTSGPDQPLVHDVIVVDEASMVDLLMMDVLFAAVRPAARIILLGDPDQLVSVDTGYVLGDICHAADACGAEHGAALGQWFECLSGQQMPMSAGATPMRDAVVRLRRSYRFEKEPGIGALADAIRTGDATRALDTLASDQYSDVRRRDPLPTLGELVAPGESLIDAYLGATEPAEALERLADFRLLCAVREGRAGVAGLNEAFERWLTARGVSTRGWYDRRPILIVANDPATGLYNGDVGVAFAAGGRTLVYFRDAIAGVRAVPPARLPAYETAWAMTVHKAQGSEFGHVVLVLPDEDNRVLTRELLYTAVTRARRAVNVVGRSDIVAAAIARTTMRASGLSARLTS